MNDPGKPLTADEKETEALMFGPHPAYRRPMRTMEVKGIEPGVAVYADLSADGGPVVTKRTIGPDDFQPAPLPPDAEPYTLLGFPMRTVEFSPAERATPVFGDLSAYMLPAFVFGEPDADPPVIVEATPKPE